MTRPHWGLAATVLGGVLLLSAGAPAATPRDRVPPTKPTIDGPLRPDGLRPVFTFGATDRQTPRGRIRFRCGFDGAALRPCARIHRPAVALSFGKHTLRARAVDLAGNVSRIATFAFTVTGRWDAARDFERAPRPANPGRDRYGNTTWFYLYSETVEHDPSRYHLSSFFRVPLPNWEVWESRAGGLSGTQTGYNNGQISMHPGHYNLGQNAILGWRSPIASTVRVTASIEPLPQSSCGVPHNGIVWSIDQGPRTLVSGPAPPGGAIAHPELTVSVAAGETLYVVVNDAGDSNCDTTLVSFSLETVD
jgi:hypothetical protein